MNFLLSLYDSPFDKLSSFYYIFNITYFLHKLLNRPDLYIFDLHILYRQFSISFQLINGVCRLTVYFIHIDTINASDSLFVCRH